MIGIFDSGVGGMSVVGAIRVLLPSVDLLYYADSGRAPYGPRPLSEVRTFAEQITQHLLDAGADTVVVACNSASAAALEHLRLLHPTVPFVGMEPAVKPAAQATASGIVGVLMTAATFQGALFASVVDRFADGVRVETQICEGWVESVEAGVVNGPEVERLVSKHLEPLLAAGADTLVLGCTHYPFLTPVIARVAGDNILVVDPSSAVARQAVKICLARPARQQSGKLTVHTSGDPSRVAASIRRLTGLAPPTTAVTLPTP